MPAENKNAKDWANYLRSIVSNARRRSPNQEKFSAQGTVSLFAWQAEQIALVLDYAANKLREDDTEFWARVRQEKREERA